ncbi:hypothetical protein [Olsenella sp. HMSC062G07]|uniref:hypothetical protein n=1 Tax=Olsenella sp. HMSC062G07 TaxID=1739330 RepID=UPI0008A3E54A|nr:hypothetical protein [Olsenella sp. HMSC062G07]OFK23299.1 hypothetical protein HMPREF2826_05140 [Olsenella sp. HMSC062G07]
MASDNARIYKLDSEEAAIVVWYRECSRAYRETARDVMESFALASKRRAEARGLKVVEGGRAL